MPVLKVHTMKLIEEHYTAPGESFVRQFAYAGTALDGRIFTNADIEQMYSDTTNYNNESGYLLRIKIGHWQEGTPFITGDEELKGFVKKLELRDAPSDEGNGRLSIWGEFHLFPETASKVREGRLPSQSIGNYTNVFAANGDQMENVLDHLAILGASTPALSELNKGDTRSIINRMSNYLDSLKSFFNRDPKQEGNQLPINQKAFNEGFDTMIETLGNMKGLFNANFEKQPDQKTEPEPQSKTEFSIKNDNPKPTANEVLKQFNELHKSDCLAHDEQDKFFSLADNAGLDYAVKFYSDNKALTPPKNEKTTSNRDEKSLSANIRKIKEINLSMGKTITDEEAAKIAEGGE